MKSLDQAGTQWQLPSQPIYRPQPDGWDGLLVTGPTVVQGVDRLWRLYYSGWGITGSVAKQGIGLLLSADGIRWQPHPNNPIFAGELGQWDAEILEPAVIYFQDHFWMWYSGMSEKSRQPRALAIGLATSKDGMHLKCLPKILWHDQSIHILHRVPKPQPIRPPNPKVRKRQTSHPCPRDVRSPAKATNFRKEAVARSPHPRANR